MGGAIGIFYIYIFFTNIILYLFIIFFLFYGNIQLRKGKKKTALLFFGLAITPIIHYTYEALQSNFEKTFRQSQINNLSKRKINIKINRPTAILAQFSSYNKELMSLVATGVLDEVQQQGTERYTKKKYVRYYKLLEGDKCIDFENSGGKRSEYRRVILARYAFQRCAKEENRDGTTNAFIELLKGDNAPNKYNGPACLGGGNNPLELRWTKNYGGELISFWESPSYMMPMFPPVLQVYPRTWLCSRIQPWDDRYYFPDVFHFVATAFGYKRVEDFPRYPDETIIPSLLRKLIPKLNFEYANNHIIALLGQWPSTPEIDKVLNSQEMLQESNGIIIKVTKLLTDKKEEKRLDTYYPNLLTHLQSFNKMCGQSINSKIVYCNKLSNLLLKRTRNNHQYFDNKE